MLALIHSFFLTYKSLSCGHKSCLNLDRKSFVSTCNQQAACCVGDCDKYLAVSYQTVVQLNLPCTLLVILSRLTLCYHLDFSKLLKHLSICRMFLKSPHTWHEKNSPYPISQVEHFKKPFFFFTFQKNLTSPFVRSSKKWQMNFTFSQRIKNLTNVLKVFRSWMFHLHPR